MATFKGSSKKHEIDVSRRRVDTRRFGKRLSAALNDPDVLVMVIVVIALLGLVLVAVPFSGELLLIFAWIFRRKFIETKNKSFDFPYRVPQLADARDGSSRQGKSKGEGITLLGNDISSKEQIYASNTDLRAHLLILGTTGSGKTELLLGIVANALVQNTGLIYVDGKGDPKLQKDFFRMARRLGREDDMLLINFITSGRDFVEKQHDKVTNNMNMMGNTSSGMLIELIVSLMDDSGGGGDMWKGRAISFVAALTRPLVYLRDKGFLNLSPEKYLEYFELNVIEELVWEHNNRYGEKFEEILAPLRNYLVTLPGYQKQKIKKQETKTLEQHGYIVMQLTRTFNDLTFNYGHIFKTNVGDVDFYDVVINRRFLGVLLPALERAPDSLRMLGKMIVGSIKQMMAGCLGNKVEGVVREIIDSRPTNSTFPFYCIFDEYGYYAVPGFAVAPAQARSLGFSITFAAQDFSSLKKSSPEEADATWENTNVRALGRTTSGRDSETFRRFDGAAGEGAEAYITGYELKQGTLSERAVRDTRVSIEKRSRLDYDDLARQENGEFTFLIGKKESKGQRGGVQVIRGTGFYTAGVAPKFMRINDFLDIEPPEPHELPRNKKELEQFKASVIDGSFNTNALKLFEPCPVLDHLSNLFDANYATTLSKPILSLQTDLVYASLGWYLYFRDTEGVKEIVFNSPIKTSPPPDTIANVEASSDEDDLGLFGDGVLGCDQGIGNALVLEALNSTLLKPILETKTTQVSDDDFLITASNFVVEAPTKTNLLMEQSEDDAFCDMALPLLKSHLVLINNNEFSSVDFEHSNRQDIANVKEMLRLEMITARKPLTSFDEKFALEEAIKRQQDIIINQTNYVDPPIPEQVPVTAVEQSLDNLKERCKLVMKSKIRSS